MWLFGFTWLEYYQSTKALKNSGDNSLKFFALTQTLKCMIVDWNL